MNLVHSFYKWAYAIWLLSLSMLVCRFLSFIFFFVHNSILHIGTPIDIGVVLRIRSWQNGCSEPFRSKLCMVVFLLVRWMVECWTFIWVWWHKHVYAYIGCMCRRPGVDTGILFLIVFGSYLWRQALSLNQELPFPLQLDWLTHKPSGGISLSVPTSASTRVTGTYCHTGF